MLVGAISKLAPRLSGAIACVLLLGCEQPRKSASPPPSSEPVLTPATDQLVFHDNMDAYTSAATMWSDASSTPRMVQADVSPLPNPDPADQLITPGRGGTGTALRIVYAGIYQEAHAWDTHNAPYTGDLVTTVIQYYGRVTTSAPIPASNLRVKWLEGWHQRAVGGRVQWNTADRPLLYSPDSWWQVYDLTSTTSGATSGQGTQPIPPSLNTIADGQWHRFTHTYRPNSAPGAQDGFVQMWVDGIKIIQISAATIGVTPPGGYKPWCDGTDVDAIAVRAGIEHLAFGAVLTTTVPSFTMDIDDLTLWTRP